MNNNILIIVDCSYWQYFTIFGAVSEFIKKYPKDAAYWIKPPEEVDQNNLPNLLLCDNFKKVLKSQVIKRLETIDWLTKANHQEDIDQANRIDILFAMDDWLKKSFRKDIYVEYKAQRALVPKSYNVFEIKNYIVNVIFKELEVEEKYNYHMLKVDGAEADDIIACVCKNISKDYMRTILYASDKDFVQLEGIDQYNLFGKKIECKIGNEKVSAQEFLGVKILIGDGSDNIGKVFSGVGPKKALKLVRDTELLNRRLLENQDAMKQYNLNKKLISFENIPTELEDSIVKKANSILYENEVLNNVDIRDFMLL